MEGGLTANPDHEVAISRVAFDERNDDGRGEVGHSGRDCSDHSNIWRIFELRQGGVVRLEDAEAEWETWLA